MPPISLRDAELQRQHAVSRVGYSARPSSHAQASQVQQFLQNRLQLLGEKHQFVGVDSTHITSRTTTSSQPHNSQHQLKRPEINDASIEKHRSSVQGDHLIAAAQPAERRLQHYKSKKVADDLFLLPTRTQEYDTDYSCNYNAHDDSKRFAARQPSWTYDSHEQLKGTSETVTSDSLRASVPTHISVQAIQLDDTKTASQRQQAYSFELDSHVRIVRASPLFCNRRNGEWCK